MICRPKIATNLIPGKDVEILTCWLEFLSTQSFAFSLCERVRGRRGDVSGNQVNQDAVLQG